MPNLHFPWVGFVFQVLVYVPGFLADLVGDFPCLVGVPEELCHFMGYQDWQTVLQRRRELFGYASFPAPPVHACFDGMVAGAQEVVDEILQRDEACVCPSITLCCVAIVTEQLSCFKERHALFG